MDILKKKVGFISLGCDKNRVDLEKMIYNIKRAGFTIVNDEYDADIIIINTCSFIKIAREESINAILTTATLKDSRLEKIIVTGCLNEMQYSDLESSLPEVDAFVNIKDNEKIVEVIKKLYDDSTKCCQFDNYNRIQTTPTHYAYLKIADGCDNFCSYCKIPYIRGRFRSEKINDLVKEANILANNGVTELVLVAQDVTKYGVDFKDGTTLVTLIKELSKIDKIKWIRLLYCYPESITDELIAEIKTNNKVCKYLDLPLQHVDTDILKAMNRRNNYDKIVALIKKLRFEIPDISLRTTFILGFPGETRKQFELLKQFVEEQKLNQVGFFTYSKEEGTRAFNFDNQVSEVTKKKRLKELSEVQYKVVNELNSTMIGRVLEVVVDDKEEDTFICRSSYHNPESDSVIFVKDPTLKIGEYYKVQITNYIDYDLEGRKI